MRDSLQSAVSSAEEAMRSIDAAIRRRKEAVDCEYMGQRNEALKVLRTATNAIQDFDEAEALRNVKLPYPEGTVLEQWTSIDRYYATATKTVKRTGVFGKVEVITRASEHPSNMASYSRASVGDVVIRLLKKDRTASLKYAKIGGWGGTPLDYWRPEGVDLNAEKNAAEIAKVRAAEQAENESRERLRASAMEVFGL